MDTRSVISAAIRAATDNGIDTMVIASTTGKNAEALLEILNSFGSNLPALRFIVITHDEGRPPEMARFNPDTKMRLQRRGIVVHTHSSPGFPMRLLHYVAGKIGLSRWTRTLDSASARHGVGIKVCHVITRMIDEARLASGRIVAVAGVTSGADSAAVMNVSRIPSVDRIVVASGVSLDRT